MGHPEEPVKTYYETFEHGADIGIRGFGHTPEEAFANAARAMFSLMVEDFSAIVPAEKREVETSSLDLEGLLVAWLNELLAEWDIQGLIFSDFSLQIQQPEGAEGECSLRGTAMGEPFSPGRHGRGVEVKGATFSNLFVGKDGDLWTAQCIVDV